jgi:L-asparagine transporter-like permease
VVYYYLAFIYRDFYFWNLDVDLKSCYFNLSLDVVKVNFCRITGTCIIYNATLILNNKKQEFLKQASFKLRLFNELATVFLVAIVFLIIVRSTGGLVWGMLGLFIFAALLMGGVYIYKKQRKAMEEKDNTPPTIPNN